MQQYYFLKEKSTNKGVVSYSRATNFPVKFLFNYTEKYAIKRAIGQ